jgi:DNA-binding transcriptional MerR regulator
MPPLLVRRPRSLDARSRLAWEIDFSRGMDLPACNKDSSQTLGPFIRAGIDRVTGVDTAGNRPTIQIEMASAIPAPDASPMDEREEKSLFRIGEVSRLTATKAFVLRYWETEFPMLQPVKSPSGHRLYRREDIETVFEIKRLLYEEGFTIAGARKHFEERGQAQGEPSGGSAVGGNGGAERPAAHAPAAPSRREAPTRQQRKFLLDLHEELLAVLTLLERE